MNPRHFLAPCLLLVLATLAAAQPRDRDQREDRRGDDRGRDRDRPRVIFYQQSDYRGSSLVAYPGDSFENLSRVYFEAGGSSNDRISSIRVEDGAEVYVYVDSGYRGAVMRLTESVRDLSGRLLPENMSARWNDRISSFRVEAKRRDARDEPRVEPDVIIKRAFLDLLVREPGDADLRKYRGFIIDQGWTELMVRDYLRRSDEFRREGADRIVRRAYLDVLGREPDPGGLRHFRDLMLNKNWTEGDVRDDMRRSEEFRIKNPGKDQPGNRR